MPSAQNIKIDEADGLAMNKEEADSPSFLQAIHAANVSNLSLLHPRGKILLAEGEPARGVHVLRTGRATVSISSREGRVVILRLAQAGDVRGLRNNGQDARAMSHRFHFMRRIDRTDAKKPDRHSDNNENIEPRTGRTHEPGQVFSLTANGCRQAGQAPA